MEVIWIVRPSLLTYLEHFARIVALIRNIQDLFTCPLRSNMPKFWLGRAGSQGGE